MNDMTPEKLLFLLKNETSFVKPFCEPIQGVAVDSRHVRKGDLFFALPGAKTDGYLFIEEAVRKGAVGVVANRQISRLPENIGLVVTEDCLKLLQDLSRSVMKSVSPLVIGVTGSIGKTTTKEFTKALLKACGRAVSTEENYNSQIGLSCSVINSLLKEKEAPKWFVAEMGMTEKGNVSKLVRIIPPEIALVTQIAPVHMMNFQSLEEIAEAKSEIFSSSNCRVSLINIDSPCSEVLSRLARGKMKTLSMKKKADYRLTVEEATLVFEYEGKKTRFQKPEFYAQHQYENLFHALVLATEAGGDVNCFQAPMLSLNMASKRLEHVVKEDVLFINDSYNAAEPSMISALHVLAKAKGGKKIAVLGQMRELGVLSKECHERVGLCAKDKADLLVCLGEECGPLFQAFQSSNKPAYWFHSLDEIHSFLPTLVENGDVVLLKGSKSNKLWEVVEQFSKKRCHV